MRATLACVKTETQNVTLSIPKDTLRKAKILAIQKNMSLSALLTQALADLVEREQAYDRARQRSLEILARGFDLGTHGRLAATREELHARDG
jgi:predicted transcriptional regulator